jgi:hypothetical protein
MHQSSDFEISKADFSPRKHVCFVRSSPICPHLELLKLITCLKNLRAVQLDNVDVLQAKQVT